MINVEQSILSLTRSTAALAMALVLISCSSGSQRDAGPGGAPRDQNNICSIFAQRPEWRPAMEASAARWGAPVAVQMAIMWRESSFRSRARPRVAGPVPVGYASSAYGYSQAIDGTWDWYRRETGNRRGTRDSFEDAADFVGWYMSKTRSTNGLSMTDAFNHYLAYHEGHTGYSRGNWRTKHGLLEAAKQVATQAQRYHAQLGGC